MANKLRLDLELDSKGYIQGAQDAVKSTKTLETSTEEYLKSFGSLRKQMVAAKKDAQNLAAQFAALSQSEKNSDFGQELAESLDIAIRKAAELQDVMADTNQAIKNASSDTQSLDAFKDALEIGKDLATAYAGAVAKLTGNEKAYKDMIANVAMIQGGFNAAIKIYNALQPQSNLMLAIGNLQLKARAIAESAATKKTLEATIAQKAFNVVAKANPYVLLVTAAVAAAAAIGGYMLATKKANNEEKKAAKAAEELKKKQELLAKNQSELSRTASEAKLKFYELAIQYQDLKTKAQKLEFIKEHSSAFKSLGIEINNVNTADRVLIDQADDVVKAILKKAIAAKKAEQIADQIIELEDKITNSREKYKNAHAGDKEIGATIADAFPDDWKKANLEYGKDYTQQMKGQVTSEYTLTEEGAKKVNKVREQAAKERLANTKKGYIAEVKELKEAYKEQVRISAQTAQEIAGLGDNGVKPTKDQLTHLQELQKAIEDLEKKRANLNINAPDFDKQLQKVLSDLEEAKKRLKDYRIAIGLDLSKSKLQELKDSLKEAEAELPFVVSEEDLQKAKSKINNLKDEIESEEVRLGIKVEPVSDGKDVKKVQDILQETFNKITPPKYDFSFIPDDFKYEGQSITDIENKYAALTEARKQLTEVMNTSTDDQAIHDAQIGLQSIGDEIDSLEPKLETLNKINEKFKQFQEISDAANKAGNYLNQLGSAFTQLGEATDSAGVKAVGIILETLANLALSFSQAMIQAASLGPWAWIAFGIAGVAQLAAMISQIKGMVSGGFAEGGVVPGSSFSGDKLLARVNSGERILTAKQNENLEKIANSQYQPYRDVGPASLSFKLKGEDLYGVMKNYKNIHRIS